MNWEQLFDSIHYEALAGATEGQLKLFKTTWNADLTKSEIDKLIISEKKLFTSEEHKNFTQHPKSYDQWKFPDRELPKSYLSFLQFCHTGITTVKGDREIQFFSTKEIRQYNLIYGLPEELPGALSIAMDGCGNQLFFDMREKTIDDEYKIYACSSSDLDWDEAKIIADSFVDFCLGETAIDQFMYA